MFAGQDTAGVTPMKLMQTLSTDSWALGSNQVMIGEQPVFRSEEVKKMLIEPQLQNIFIPTDDFRSFKKLMHGFFGNENIQCSDSCRFANACILYRNKHLDLTVSLSDARDISLDLNIPWENLLQDKHGRCELAIYESDSRD